MDTWTRGMTLGAPLSFTPDYFIGVNGYMDPWNVIRCATVLYARLLYRCTPEFNLRAKA